MSLKALDIHTEFVEDLRLKFKILEGIFQAFL